MKKVTKGKNGEIRFSNGQMNKWPNAISGQVKKGQVQNGEVRVSNGQMNKQPSAKMMKFLF